MHSWLGGQHLCFGSWHHVVLLTATSPAAAKRPAVRFTVPPLSYGVRTGTAGTAPIRGRDEHRSRSHAPLRVMTILISNVKAAGAIGHASGD